MTDIIPAILTNDAAELDRLLAALKAAGVTRVHVDILDDTLIPGRTVTGYEQLNGRDLGMELDVHLMVALPDEHIAKWQGVSRFIVHVESHGDLEHAASACVASGVQFWAAINPDTPLGTLTGLSCHLDGAMFMTVEPGAQGRPFRPDVLEKIQLLKSERDLPVMVDGGINPTTAPQCAAAGASALVCGSFIVKNASIEEALAQVRQSVS